MGGVCGLTRDGSREHVHHQLLHRLRTGKRIIIMRGQARQVILAAVGVYDDGCGKTAIDGQDRRGGEAIEMECLLLLTTTDQFLVRADIALWIDKRDDPRTHPRPFCVLSRWGREGCPKPPGSKARM